MNEGNRYVTMRVAAGDIMAASFSHSTSRKFERFWLYPHDPSADIAYPLQFAKTGYSRWQRGEYYERTDYTSFGIEVVTAGNALYTHKRRTHTVNRGSAFLKLPGSGHRYETGPAGFLHKRFINMHGAGLGSMVDMAGLTDCPVVDGVDIRWFVERQREAAGLIAAREPQFSIPLAAVVYQVLLKSAVWARGASWPVGLREAVAFLHSRVRQMPSVEEMAAAARTSVPGIHRAFREHFGTSPQRYFRTMKMRLAADMLQHSAMPIKNIAFELGYENPFAFSTQFRKTMGTSPRCYRRERLPEYEEAIKV